MYTFYLSITIIYNFFLKNKLNNYIDFIILLVILFLEKDILLIYTIINNKYKETVFADWNWISFWKILVYQLFIVFKVIEFNRNFLLKNRIIFYIYIKFKINDYIEKKIILYIIELVYYLIILGIVWFKKYNFYIDFVINLFPFNSLFCYKFCNILFCLFYIKALPDIFLKTWSIYLLIYFKELKNRDITIIFLKVYLAYIYWKYKMF